MIVVFLIVLLLISLVINERAPLLFVFVVEILVLYHPVFHSIAVL